MTALVPVTRKGGPGKTTTVHVLAGVASQRGMTVLLIDADPAGNLSRRMGFGDDAPGLDRVLAAAAVELSTVTSDDLDIAGDALASVVRGLTWPGVDIVPAGPGLARVMNGIAEPDLWRLRDVLQSAGVYDTYDVVLFDTAGLTGPLVSLALYAADTAFTVIGPNPDSVHAAVDAKARVQRIRDAHRVAWAGAVITGLDLRCEHDGDVLAMAEREFPGQVLAEIRQRSLIRDVVSKGQRLADVRGFRASSMAKTYGALLDALLAARSTRNEVEA